MKREPCPNEAEHTSDPKGYLEWYDWAENKAKTHRQIQCPGCGLWAIWVLKDDASLADGGARTVPSSDAPGSEHG